MTLKDILQNIGRRHGVENLNPMQKAVMQARANRIILLAPTGSGKTLAFTVPMVGRMHPSDGRIQALVIAPSRELVIQIAEVVRSVATGYKVTALYGGHSMAEEVNTLSVTPDIVVATPGRLLDHILRETIDVSAVQTLVLDEFDKALELGFHDQMRRIVRRVKHVRYVMLTSATPLVEMPDFLDMSQAKVLDFSTKTESPRSRMNVSVVRSDMKDKLEALGALLSSLPDGKTIVFVNHRESAERVYKYLAKHGYPAGLYHGGMDQLQREIAIDMLNNGSTPILVSTDLGARGLDVDAVRSVVHYHIPPTAESWTHRNGRTARVDAEGDVYVLINDEETMPDYVDADREYTPDTCNPNPIRSHLTTLYFNAGKKEKLSKGDILGFLAKQCGVEASRIGKIVVKDHCALVAVDNDDVKKVTDTAKTAKVKGQRVRVTPVVHDV